MHFVPKRATLYRHYRMNSGFEAEQRETPGSVSDEQFNDNLQQASRSHSFRGNISSEARTSRGDELGTHAYPSVDQAKDSPSFLREKQNVVEHSYHSNHGPGYGYRDNLWDSSVTTGWEVSESRGNKSWFTKTSPGSDWETNFSSFRNENSASGRRNLRDSNMQSKFNYSRPGSARMDRYGQSRDSEMAMTTQWRSNDNQSSRGVAGMGGGNLSSSNSSPGGVASRPLLPGTGARNGMYQESGLNVLANSPPHQHNNAAMDVGSTPGYPAGSSGPGSGSGNLHTPAGVVAGTVKTPLITSMHSNRGTNMANSGRVMRIDNSICIPPPPPPNLPGGNLGGSSGMSLGQRANGRPHATGMGMGRQQPSSGSLSYGNHPGMYNQNSYSHNPNMPVEGSAESSQANNLTRRSTFNHNSNAIQQQGSPSSILSYEGHRTLRDHSPAQGVSPSSSYSVGQQNEFRSPQSYHQVSELGLSSRNTGGGGGMNFDSSIRPGAPVMGSSSSPVSPSGSGNFPSTTGYLSEKSYDAFGGVTIGTKSAVPETKIKVEDDWDDDGFGGGVSTIDIAQLQRERNLRNSSAEAREAAAAAESHGAEVTGGLGSQSPVSNKSSQRNAKPDLGTTNSKGAASKLETSDLNAGDTPKAVIKAAQVNAETAAEAGDKKMISAAKETASTSATHTHDEVSKEAVDATVSPAEASQPSPVKKGVWRPGRGADCSTIPDRQIKSFLNKLTIEKFPVIAEKLSNLEETVRNEEQIMGVVGILIDKAVLEPDWSEMYADLCEVLYWRCPSIAGGSRVFRSCLISKIEAEYQRIPRTLELSPEEAEGLDASEIEFRVKKKKNHILGVVKLIAELFQRDLLSFNVVQMVVVDLVVNKTKPDEHYIECFLQLINTAGYFIETSAHKRVLDFWFGRLSELQYKDWYSRRLKCVIQDVLDLRKSKWHKKVHREQAKALKDLHVQLENEQAAGGSTIAAQYGKVVVVGKRNNCESSAHYAEYMNEQRIRFGSKEDKQSA